MSIQALNWAFGTEVKPATRKLALICLCNFCNDTGLAYPSIAKLSEDSSLDRKTLISALDDLERAGMITDTGKRTGTTAQVKVYRVNSPENGTASKSPVFPMKESRFSHERVPKTGHGTIKEPSVTSTPLAPQGEPGSKSEGNGAKEKKAQSARLPTSEQAKAFSKVYNRRLTTPWSEKEIKAFKALGPLELSDIELVGAYTEAERKKGKDSIHRRDLLTMLNNFLGEVDRANEWRRKNRKAVERMTEKINGHPAVEGDPEGWKDWLEENYPTATAKYGDAPEDIKRDFRAGMTQRGKA